MVKFIIKPDVAWKMYIFLNKFFFVFHSFIIIFNLTGWIFRKTRFANLILLSLTFFSWFFLGIWYGFGYCPSTEWHWKVRIHLGYHDMTSSYIKFLIDSLTGLDAPAKLVDGFAVIFLILALGASITTNIRDWRMKN
jgi:hypothetical protein